MNAFIHPAGQPLTGTVDPPSSKNYTTRYILTSSLAEGRSIVRKPAVQDDAVALVKCLRQMGAKITAYDRYQQETDFTVANATGVDYLLVEGFGDSPRVAPGDIIDPANAGTVLRLLLGTAALCAGEVRFETAHYKESLGTRPNADLLDALRLMGVEVEATGDKGALPITIRGGKGRIKAALSQRRQELGLASDEPVWIPVSGSVSSQFASSLLFLAPLLDEDIEVRVVDDLKSRPLVNTTCSVIKEAGVRLKWGDHNGLPAIRIPGGGGYKPRTWSVNGDWPGAAAILGAAAAVPNSRIVVRRLRNDEQGERRCLDFYLAMGCEVRKGELDGERVLEFSSPEKLSAASINGDLCTDAVLAMMGAACAADGESVFEGIQNLQFKECDRVREPITELLPIFETGANGGKPAASWEPEGMPDVIRVTGAPGGYTGGIHVDGRGDHRVIMMLSIVGLRCREGLSIRGAEHVAKSFPLWFETLREMGVSADLA